MPFNTINALTNGGGIIQTPPITFTNKTGAACVEGGIYMLDLRQADADSTTVDLGIGNILKPTTAGMAIGFFVIGDKSLPIDDARGGFYAGDFFETKVLVNASSTNIAKGDPIKPVNGQVYGVKATAGTDKYVAIALEAATTDGALIRCLCFSRPVI